jgi:septum site-determining protein MinD
MLALDDIEDLLGLPLLGVVPESTSVLTGTNLGTPVASMPGDDAGQAYSDAAARMLGETRDMRFTTLEEKSFLQSLFGR